MSTRASRALSRLVALALLLLAPAPARAEEPAPIALLSALDAEARPVLAALTDREAVGLLGIPCVVGRLDGRRAVVAVTGVGKVNAALTTALVIQRFSPAAVIFTGVAGALDPELQPGDVLVGEKLVQHDLVNHTEQGAVLRSVRNPRDGAANPIVLEASASLLALARQASTRVEKELTPARLRFGTIATGDSFVGSREKKAALREQLGADAVEMEGAAVAQVCHELGVPFLVVRGLSDRAGTGARDEARSHLETAARNAAITALAVARALRPERPERP